MARMKRTMALMLLASVAVCAGCAPKPTAPQEGPPVDYSSMGRELFVSRQSTTAPSSAPATTSAPSDASTEHMLVVRLHLATIEVPIGAASGNEEIWSFLDEDAVQSPRWAGPLPNGIRAGIAPARAWDELARRLSRLTGHTVDRYTSLGLPGQPVQMTLKPGQGPVTLFISHRDRTISGQDYPPGDALLLLSATTDARDPSKVMITCMPQIRSSKDRPLIISEGSDGRRLAFVPTLSSLEPVTFQTAMDSNDMLVIGPGAQSRSPYSVGRHFLVKDKNGMEFETVLVVIPEVMAAPAHQEAQPIAAN